MHRYLTGASALALAITIGAPAALAQGSEAEARERPASDVITVTARRREETIQDAPISIEAFSAEDIDELGVQNLFDVVDFTPNFILEKRSTGTDERPVVRGIAIPDIAPTQQTVSFFVDGVSIFGSFGNLPLGPVERVEIVRGPQSALYGRATFAGAVNYVLKKPGDVLEGEFEAEIAEHDSYRAELNLMGPISDTLGFRLGASHYEYGGEHRNQFSGEFYGAEQNTAYNGALIWQPTANFELYGSLTASFDRNAPGAYGRFPAGYKQCLTGLNDETPAVGDDTVGWVCGELESEDVVINAGDDLFAEGPGYDADTYLASLTATYTFDNGVELQSITGYNTQDYERRDNQSRVPLSIFDLFFPGGSQAIDVGEFETEFQEIRLTSPGDARLRWIVGAAYRNETFTLDRIQGALQSSYPDIDETTNFGVFGSLSYDFTDQLTVTAEARAQNDEIKRTNTSFGTASSAEIDFDSFLPRVIVEYEPSDEYLFYASYARGNRPGATDLTTGIPGQPLEEEFNDSYELGMKSTLADGALLFNVIGFYSQWSNIFGRTAFFSDPSDPTTLDSVVRNEGDADIYGLEISGAWQVAEPFTVGFSYGYVDAAFERGYNTREAFDLLGADAEDFLDGNRPRYVPEHTAAANAVFETPITEQWNVRLRGDVTYIGERYATELNTATYGPSTKVNLSAAVHNGDVELELFGRNVFDDDTLLSSGRFINLAADGTRQTNSQNFIAEGTLPRGPQWGVRLRYRFGG